MKYFFFSWRLLYKKDLISPPSRSWKQLCEDISHAKDNLWIFGFSVRRSIEAFCCLSISFSEHFSLPGCLPLSKKHLRSYKDQVWKPLSLFKCEEESSWLKWMQAAWGSFLRSESLRMKLTILPCLPHYTQIIFKLITYLPALLDINDFTVSPTRKPTAHTFPWLSGLCRSLLLLPAGAILPD